MKDRITGFVLLSPSCDANVMDTSAYGNACLDICDCSAAVVIDVAAVQSTGGGVYIPACLWSHILLTLLGSSCFPIHVCALMNHI